MTDFKDYWNSGLTGSTDSSISKVVSCKIEKYEIDIALNKNNEFVDVVGIKVNQKYLDISKIKIDKKFINVDDLYNE